MTNHMEEVAKLLGVELEEEFRIEGTHVDYIYKISEKGLFLHCSGRDWWEEVPDTLVQMLAGMTRKIIKFPWKPQKDDTYYMPTVTSTGKCIKLFWTGSKNDEYSYQQGLVYKTSREAIELAEEMLAVAKERFAMAKEG